MNRSANERKVPVDEAGWDELLPVIALILALVALVWLVVIEFKSNRSAKEILVEADEGGSIEHAAGTNVVEFVERSSDEDI